MDVCTPHQKYQVQFDLFPWLSPAFVAAIFRINHLFRFYQKNKSSSNHLPDLQFLQLLANRK